MTVEYKIIRLAISTVPAELFKGVVYTETLLLILN